MYFVAILGSGPVCYECTDPVKLCGYAVYYAVYYAVTLLAILALG